jgi:FMN-dependent oxidoreductase (nitrilotriacetate monooxygenase family)
MGMMRLGLFMLQGGHHIAAWRHPRSPDATENVLPYFTDIATLAERGLFDMVFLADSTAPWGAALERTARAAVVEPTTLLAALAVVTKHIGLVATSTTTYDEPYLVARKFASLDLISGGRAGWNLVTSSNEREAHNFGRDAHMAHANRYERASEFADVVLGLWESWDDNAFVRDRKSGVYFDVNKLHLLNHHGKHFSVKGPLNVPGSPQRRPIVVQAGSSGPGQELAARTADVVFTVQQDLKAAQKFYGDVKAHAATHGRSPSDILIMPGLVPVVGTSAEDARSKLAELNELIVPELGVALLSSMIDMDLTPYPLDGLLPEVPETNLNKGRQKVAVDLARRENLTIRQLYKRLVASRAHLTVVGAPADIADMMEEWLKSGAADGFNIMPAILPLGLEEFINLVIPELQRRGLFRTSYTGRTLRENLGLRMPATRSTRHAAN